MDRILKEHLYVVKVFEHGEHRDAGLNDMHVGAHLYSKSMYMGRLLKKMLAIMF